MEQKPNFTKKMSRTDILRELMDISEQVRKAHAHLKEIPTANVVFAEINLKKAQARLDEVCKLI